MTALRHLTSLEEWSVADVERVLDLAARLKHDGHGRPLAGRSAALVWRRRTAG